MLNRRSRNWISWLVIVALLLPIYATRALAEENVSASKTVILHPVADTYVQRGAPEANFGDSEQLELRYQSSVSGNNRNIYLKFDLAEFNRMGDHVIHGAKLRLFLSEMSPSDFSSELRYRLKIVDHEWEERELGWGEIVPEGDNVAPGIQLLQTQLAVPESGQWLEFDLSDQLAQFAALDAAAFAFEIVIINPNAVSLLFSSREGVAPPELVFEAEGPELESIVMDAPPNKTQYYVGESLDLTGLVVTGHYSDGVQRALTGFQVSGFDGGEAVEGQLITLSAEGRSASFAIDILPPELISIEVTQPPDQTLYALGEELNLSGLVVTGHYVNGSSRVLLADEFMVSGFDSDELNEELAVTVAAGGHTDQFVVQILPIRIVTLGSAADSFISQVSTGSNYGTWDIMQLKLDNFGNTNRKPIIRFDLTSQMVMSPESILSAAIRLYKTTGGTGGVGVHPIGDNSWQEGMISWDNVPAHTVSSTASTEVGAEGQYYEWDITSYLQANYDKNLFSFAFVGETHNAQITFASKEGAEGIRPELVLRTLQPALESIAIASPPSKTQYYVGQELDLTGLVVMGQFEGGASYELISYEVSGFDSSSPQTGQMITVTVEDDITASFVIDILAPSGINPPMWPPDSELTASSVSRTRVALSWTAAQDNDEVIAYRLLLNGEVAAVLNGSALNHVFTGLTPLTNYEAAIEAGDSEGNWTPGPILNVFTELSEIAFPEAVSIESGQFDLDDWTVTVNSDGSANWVIADGNLRLDAFASAGSEPLRNVIVHGTPLIGDFAWTGKVAVQPRGDWDDLAVVFNYIDAENYYFVSLNRSNDDATHGIFKVVNNASMQLADFEVGIMTPGTVHELRIDRSGSLIRAYLDGDFIGEAEDGAFTAGRVGFGSANDYVTLSEMKVYGTELIDLSPPSAPGQLSAEAQSSKAVRLTWEASQDDSGIKLYAVYRDGQLLGTTNALIYVDEGLAPNSTHSYYVIARDVADKDSEPSVTVTATTLAQDTEVFPFSHALIDNALREPLLQYQLSLEWTSRSKRSGAALIYLMTAAMFNPDYTGSDGITVKTRILEHFRHMLVPNSNREPGASGSLDTSATAFAIQAFSIASTMPDIWSELTELEKHKITLIMKAHLIAAHWAHDDDNNFGTGIDQLGNFNKGWNPNFIEGAIGNALAATRYLGGAEEANAFLLQFDYDQFMGEIQAAGLASIAWTFSQTGKTALEAAVKNTFTYKGHSLDEPFQWIKERALIMYNKTVKAEVYSGGTLRAWVNNPEGLPNIGQLGMAHEFDTVDANGLRSDLDYATRGWNNSLVNLLTFYYYGDEAAEQELSQIVSLYEVGSTDLIYKATHGYYGYAKGSAYPLRDATTADAYVGYYWLKELWENVINQPALIPLLGAEEPSVPRATLSAGVDEAIPGQQTEWTIGAVDVETGFTALEVIVHYDPQVMQFDTEQQGNTAVLRDSALVSLNGSYAVSGAVREDLGQIFILMFTSDNEHAIAGTAPLFKLIGQVKTQTAAGQSAIVQLSDFVVSFNGESQTLDTAAAAAAISIVEESAPVEPADFAQLIAKIAQAQSVFDQAQTGNKIGQYPASARTALGNALASGKSVRDNGGASQSAVDTATAALQTALQAYYSSIITLAEGATRVSIRDLSILAQYFGIDSDHPDWGKVAAADLNDYGVIGIEVLAAVARMILDDWSTNNG